MSIPLEATAAAKAPGFQPPGRMVAYRLLARRGMELPPVGAVLRIDPAVRKVRMEALHRKRAFGPAAYLRTGRCYCRLGIFPFRFDVILHRDAKSHVRRRSICKRADRIQPQDVRLGALAAIPASLPLRDRITDFLNKRRNSLVFGFIQTWAPGCIALALLVLSYMKLVGSTFNPFIYFRF